MVYDLLVRFLGKPSNCFHERKQYNFNCPSCAKLYNNGLVDSKFNLEVKLNNTNKKFRSKHICKCWKCHYSGQVERLIIDFAPSNIHKSYLDYKDDYFLIGDDSVITRKINKEVVLPKEFISFKNYDVNDSNHRWAYNYLKNERGLSYEEIIKFNIGFCLKGKYHHRIIIPSYDKYNRLNYFITRTFHNKEKNKYDNPNIDKTNIIVNENNINWNSTVFITEGVFDMFPLPPNTIPLLGLILYELLLNKLITHKPNVVLCLDKEAYKDSLVILKVLINNNIPTKILTFDKKDCGDYNKDNEKYKLVGLIKDYENI